MRLMYSSKLVWLSPLFEDQKRTKRFNSSCFNGHRLDNNHVHRKEILQAAPGSTHTTPVSDLVAVRLYFQQVVVRFSRLCTEAGKNITWWFRAKVMTHSPNHVKNGHPTSATRTNKNTIHNKKKSMNKAVSEANGFICPNDAQCPCNPSPLPSRPWSTFRSLRVAKWEPSLSHHYLHCRSL